jgi:hypothetical protein
MTEKQIPWRVIRAAPDLLEALEALVAGCEKFGIPEKTHKMQMARAAIAKAKGEEFQPEERKENAAN